MTNKEYKAFLNEGIRPLMPNLFEWLEKHPDTVEAWYKHFFSEWDERVCRDSVSRIIADGSLQAYDFHNFPAKVRPYQQAFLAELYRRRERETIRKMCEGKRNGAVPKVKLKDV